MKQYLTIKNLIIAAIGMTVIAILVFFLTHGTPALPSLLSATPANNSANNNVVDPLSLEFNVPVPISTITVTSDPPENWVLSQKDPQTITLNHKIYLQSATKYTISLTYNKKPLQSYIFTTAGGQASPRFYQQLQNDLATNYPLAKQTPFENGDVRVVYSGPLTLQITIKNPTIGSVGAISETKTWVTNQGVDPATHTYVIATSSPAPTK